MELTLVQGRLASLARREKRLSRARWWFGRMRQVVDHAIDWQAANISHAEQIFLAVDGKR